MKCTLIYFIWDINKIKKQNKRIKESQQRDQINVLTLWQHYYGYQQKYLFDNQKKGKKEKKKGKTTRSPLPRLNTAATRPGGTGV